jgi:hypothetical protein
MNPLPREMLLASGVVLALACTPANATAQADTPRLFGQIFGASPARSSRTQSLDLSLSFLAGYDQNAVGALANTSDYAVPRFIQSSALATANAVLAFNRAHRLNSISATARSGIRYYPSVTNVSAADFGASCGIHHQISRRVQGDANAQVAYEPYYSLLAIPAFTDVELSSVSGDYGMAKHPSVGYDGNASTRIALSRRTNATIGYAFRGFDLTGAAADGGSMRQQNGNVSIGRDLTSRLAIGAGYDYSVGTGSYTNRHTTTSGQGGQVSMDYHQTLRSKRTLKAGFSVGFSAYETREPDHAGRADRLVTARLHLSAGIGRTWVVSSEYRRGIRQLPGVAAPAYSDDVRIGIGGVVSRRVDLSVNGGFSKGAESTNSIPVFKTATGGAVVRWAIARREALRADYLYYWHEFPPNGFLPAGLSRRLGRHAVRVGLDVWLPLHR